MSRSVIGLELAPCGAVRLGAGGVKGSYFHEWWPAITPPFLRTVRAVQPFSGLAPVNSDYYDSDITDSETIFTLTTGSGISFLSSGGGPSRGPLDFTTDTPLGGIFDPPVYYESGGEYHNETRPDYRARTRYCAGTSFYQVVLVDGSTHQLRVTQKVHRWTNVPICNRWEIKDWLSGASEPDWTTVYEWELDADTGALTETIGETFTYESVHAWLFGTMQPMLTENGFYGDGWMSQTNSHGVIRAVDDGVPDITLAIDIHWVGATGTFDTPVTFNFTRSNDESPWGWEEYQARVNYLAAIVEVRDPDAYYDFYTWQTDASKEAEEEPIGPPYLRLAPVNRKLGSLEGMNGSESVTVRYDGPISSGDTGVTGSPLALVVISNGGSTPTEPAHVCGIVADQRYYSGYPPDNRAEVVKSFIGWGDLLNGDYTKLAYTWSLHDAWYPPVDGENGVTEGQVGAPVVTTFTISGEATSYFTMGKGIGHIRIQYGLPALTSDSTGSTSDNIGLTSD